MVLKLIAFTLRGYIASKWNVFDGLVVILSIIDLFVEIFVTAESNGDFTIIRSLRLVRKDSNIRIHVQYQQYERWVKLDDIHCK